jgi:type VI secretion system protein ImpH
MAHPHRTPTDFLSALAAIAGEAHGPAMLRALGAELARRRGLGTTVPEPWTKAAAVDFLAAQPHGASLFGALRLLQGAQPDKAALGRTRRAEDDPVRIEQTLLLGFAPSEVDAVEAGAGATGRPRLRQSAIGLLGPNGALPQRWTDHAHDLVNDEYRSRRDASFHAWLDVLQRRHVALFYRAWSDAQAATGADVPGQPHPIADRLRALAGAALAGLRDRDGIADDFKMAHACALSRRVRSAPPLAAMLARHFDAPVRIEEFVAHWLEIPPGQRTTLGGRFPTLGADAVLGARTRDATVRFRVVVGPLPLERYRRFLPPGEDHARLRDLVGLYVGAEHEWELVPVLARAQVPYGWLGNPGMQLGWTAWLGVRLDDADADDLALAMTPRLQAGAAPTLH